MTAILVGICVGLAMLAVRRPDTATAVAAYVVGDSGANSRPSRSVSLRLLPGVTVGGIIGAALLPMPLLPSAALGAVGGALGQWLGTRRRQYRMSQRLGGELPVVADLIALYILSGDSVMGSLRHLAAETSGVATAEIREALRQVDEGMAVHEALRRAGDTSSHPDAARLFGLLGAAHRSGARLVEALEIYSADRRSAIGQAIAEEGGRRALTGYGPILGLMIPTTLVFLMYPTLAGLDALAARP